MMESNFYSDEFEQLIREKTEQYKMYPSEKVWKGVHSSLHTKRKWFITGMFLLVTGTLFMAGKELITPGHATPAKKIASTGNSSSSLSKTPDEDRPAATFSAFQSIAQPVEPGRRNEEVTGDASSHGEIYKGLDITITDPVISQPDLSEYLSKVVNLPAETPPLPVNEKTLARVENSNVTDDKSIQDPAISNDNQASTDNKEISKDYADAGVGAKAGSRSTRTAKTNLLVSATASGPDVYEETLKDPAGTAAKNSPLNTLSEALDQQRANWLQDYAMNNMPAPSKSGRKLWQIFMAPTVEYLSLNGNWGLKGNIPPSLFNSVNHNTAFGLEAGGNFLYRLTRNLTVKGGLQFNFSRYSTTAYTTGRPLDKSLNSYIGYYQDSVNFNITGEKALTHDNDSYRLSAPVGFDLRVLGNERLQFHVGASFAPVYLLNTNAYVLSTGPDQPYYTRYDKSPSPSPYRKWNYNGGVEAFLTYKTRNVTWQVGPEFHYQLLSTYNSQYPISENQKGYGLKIGITKAFR